MKVLISIISILSIVIADNISGYEIAKMISSREEPKDSKSKISMLLINMKNNKERHSEMVSISKDEGNKMLLFFKSPKRDKGIGFLKIESEDSDKLSLFIPKLKKIRRISSSNQSESFMGSDLSFEDLLSRDLEEFSYKILSEDENVYVLETTPKDNVSGYSKHISWVSKDTYLIIKEESYDKNNKLFKEKEFKHEGIKNYMMVSEISVYDIQKKHKTILQIDYLEIDSDIDNNVFQENNLKRSQKFIK